MYKIFLFNSVKSVQILCLNAVFLEINIDSFL